MIVFSLVCLAGTCLCGLLVIFYGTIAVIHSRATLWYASGADGDKPRVVRWSEKLRGHP